MKRTIIALALVAFGVAACSQSPKPIVSDVTDINPAPSPVPAYQPAPIATAQPVVYDSVTPMPAGATLGNGSYTVKKGDTLYGIARQRYGDGKQWTRIASANPGLRPETLKVGQSISVP